MQDAADYELQKEPDDGGPPVARRPSRLPWIVGGLIVVAIAVAAVYFLRRDAAPASAPEGSVGTEAMVPPARPLGADAEPIDLPPLDETDPLVRELVRGLSSHPRVLAWLATDGLVRNFTVVVENIAAGRTPSRQLPVLKPTGPFRVAETGENVFIDPRSYDRYNEIAAAVGSVDAAGAARLYSMLKPRIEDAYREIGQGRSFDTTLQAAIVHLLEAPPLAGDITLVPRGGLYQFNDSRIERLSPAQKQLVRMGPRNVRVIQGRLRDIALALGIAPERLPAR